MKKKDFTLKKIELKEKRVFRDAIHNYIHVDYNVILQLINSSSMQRLKRIKQLGGTHQVYQTAEHSRFTHSMGVYAIVRRMIHESVIGDYLNEYDQITVMIAGLLHDLGHGPFSHCFENVFQINHEEYTIKIIQEDKEIHSILENCVEGLCHDVCAVIQKTHKNKILIQMISSQLDADRMDYLLRDSYFTGTTYGQFDISRLLRVMQVYEGKIVYKQSGVQAIENYILARYHMYWQVYYHPTTRSYEQIMMGIFMRVKDLYKENYDMGDILYLLPLFKDDIKIEDYLKLDENIFMYYFRLFSESQDKILSDLANRFLNRKLLNYEDYTGQKQRISIEQDCQQKGYNPRYYVFIDDQMQIPYLHYGNKDDIREIEIIKNEQLVFLSDVSEIVGAIIQSDKNKSDSKIYFPK
ncbi:MAG: HD domain-containing protein [Faecalibacillus sp.]